MPTIPLSEETLRYAAISLILRPAEVPEEVVILLAEGYFSSSVVASA